MKPKKIIKGKKSYGKRNILGKNQKVHKSKDNNNGETYTKGQKNAKFAQRGKQMQEEHRRQKRIEDKYRAETSVSAMDTYMQKDDLIREELENKEEATENTYDDLLSALSSGQESKRASEMVISSDEDEEENEGVENDDDDDDDDIGEHSDESDENAVEENNLNNLDALFSTDDEDEDEATAEKKDKEEDLDYVDPTQNASDEDDDEIDIDNDNQVQVHKIPVVDYFAQHVDYELTPEHLENLLATPIQCHKYNHTWPVLGKLDTEVSKRHNEDTIKNVKDILPSKPVSRQEELIEMGINGTLVANLNEPLTDLQLELLTIVNRYHDLYYPKRTHEDAAQLLTVYCIHALNHLKKTRGRVLQHNAKLAAATNAAKEAAQQAKRQRKNKLKLLEKSKKKAPTLDANIIPDSYRDQGFVRPKVLILLPTRNAAFEVVNNLAHLCFGSASTTTSPSNTKNTKIMNYERFVEAYTGNSLHFPKLKPKPEDYERTFAGNTDDNFRLGMTLTKKCLKLFTDFYSSDILLASPLGLRTIIGAPGSTQRDYDFLNSIELLIIDQADMLFAQNWENVLHVLEHLHLQPQSLNRTADFQRVRPWYINGWSRFYRQTMLFATHQLPEFKALLNNKCANYAGKVNIPRDLNDIRNVLINLPQVFERFKVPSLQELDDKRFEYFVTYILPRFSDTSFAHCLIYVPSYFDYVRLRNHFRKEHTSFVQICEYTKTGKIARARDIFYHSGAHFMLYSERAHYFRRTRIKGIRHLIMYAPPAYPHFYSEMINLMQNHNQNARDGLQDNMSITVLYNNYDAVQLSNILGNNNAIRLLNSSDMVHAFTAE